MFPLMLLKSVNSFYKSEFQQVTEMKKDAIYRLKNNEKIAWRTILYGVAKQFPGNVNGMKDFLSFVKTVEALLPPEYMIEGIRADCGFADPAVMSYAEEKGWQYICKLPKKATVKKAIAYLQQHPAFWETLEEEEETIRFATEDETYTLHDAFDDLQKLGQALHEECLDTTEHFHATRKYVRRYLHGRTK